MTHTVDSLMALADRYRDLKVGEGTAHARKALRSALTEALGYSDVSLINESNKAQPVREPLTDDDISDIWDSWLINITDKISAIQFARAIESAHHIGGDK